MLKKYHKHYILPCKPLFQVPPLLLSLQHILLVPEEKQAAEDLSQSSPSYQINNTLLISHICAALVSDQSVSIKTEAGKVSLCLAFA